MRIKRIGIAAAIISTFGFSCHNEPDYARVGMSNPPGGSGSATAAVFTPPAGAGAATAAPSVTGAPTGASKGAAKK